MSTDRELLELAAKAAGMKLTENGVRNPGEWEWLNAGDQKAGLFRWNPNGSQTCWNPLRNEGDRYRLARKLRLSIDFDWCSVKGSLPNGQLIQEDWGGELDGDGYAVLKVAAELGRRS